MRHVCSEIGEWLYCHDAVHQVYSGWLCGDAAVRGMSTGVAPAIDHRMPQIAGNMCKFLKIFLGVAPKQTFF